MLIDGGPNNKVLDCLGRYMPFYDREIDVVVLTHPQKDHMQGLISVLGRYNVKYMVMGVEGNETLGYTQLVDIIRKKNIQVKNLYKGDRMAMVDVRMDVLWPTREYVVNNLTMKQCSNETMGQCNQLASAKGKVEQLQGGAVLGMTSDTDLNNFSFYMHLSYGSFDVLFTGDGDMKIQPSIESLGAMPQVEVLKFPHHGSKTGMSAEFLDLLHPKLVVISVGKNSYGHPAREALEILSERDIKILRTDKDGDVIVEADGTGWSVN